MFKLDAKTFYRDHGKMNFHNIVRDSRIESNDRTLAYENNSSGFEGVLCELVFHKDSSSLGDKW